MAALYHNLAYLAYLAHVGADVGAHVGAQAFGLPSVQCVQDTLYRI